MQVIRSDKCKITIDGALIKVSKYGYSEPYFIDRCKYIDVDHQAVFIIEGNNVSPTYATLRKLDSNLISVIMRNLFSESACLAL